MRYAACCVSIAPLRAQNSDRSEMVSQLLFGETCTVQESVGNWRYVACAWDGYEGWVDAKQIIEISFTEFEKAPKNAAISLSLMDGLMAADYFMPITLGATLPNFDGLRCHLGEHSFQFSGSIVTPGQKVPSPDWVVRLAKRYLHAPYLWGGRSPFGIDCSGFTQMVYKIAGIRLFRDASQQVTQGNTIDFIEQSQPGDLAFFDAGNGKISHVGILLPEQKIIHSSGWVRIDRVDHFGIFNVLEQRYTHQLRVVKRHLPKLEPTILPEKNTPNASEDLTFLVTQTELAF